MFVLTELGFDGIVAEPASQQDFEAMEYDYVGQSTSNPRKCRDEQTYPGQHHASDDTERHLAHDIEGFEMLDLLVSVVCHRYSVACSLLLGR